jgi:hypothetical protein
MKTKLLPVNCELWGEGPISWKLCSRNRFGCKYSIQSYVATHGLVSHELWNAVPVAVLHNLMLHLHFVVTNRIWHSIFDLCQKEIHNFTCSFLWVWKLLLKSHGSSVGIATGYVRKTQGFRVRVLVESRFLSSLCRPDWSWSPSSLLSNECQRICYCFL